MRAAALALAIGVLHAQVSYVASVKPNRDPDARTISEYFAGGRLSATAAPAALLLRLAYRTQPYLIVGAPDWARTKRFDIEAKAEGNPPPSQQDLLQAILKDRFQLSAHRETREMPIFALVLARKDGKLGPQISRSDFDCEVLRTSPHPLPEPGRTPQCGMMVGPAALSGKAITMSQLVATIGGLMGRTLVDRTDLPGLFDVQMNWTPEGPPDAASHSEYPPLVTALVEQLGFKLVSDKGRVEVLVVDRIEEPSGN